MFLHTYVNSLTLIVVGCVAFCVAAAPLVVVAVVVVAAVVVDVAAVVFVIFVVGEASSKPS